MHVAMGAVRDAPGIALEPGELRGRLGAGRAAGSFAKATDVITVALLAALARLALLCDPPGIGAAAVLVSALHDDALVLMRDGVTAGGAEQTLFLLWLGIRLCFDFLPAVLPGNG